ncbi:MAG: ATP-binding protein [Candidatus Marinimicrobia bacterium]|nr:ATP-binding protein [Candidatus Neomarinimicrobiota bacterium]
MKDLIKDIILSFQRQFQQLSPFPRSLDVPVHLSKDKAITIYGPRRAGKTYYLFYLISKHLKAGTWKIEDIIYVNFEDNRLLDLKASDLDLILNSYYELFPENIPVLFLDEIQNIENWSKWIRKLVDLKYPVFITGSNARLLSREIATELRGRTLSFMLLPLSFKEFLAFNHENVQPNDRYDSKQRATLLHWLDRYLEQGGFPETLHLSNIERQWVLQEYINSIVFRDIAERYAIKNTYMLKFLINYILENYATLFSVNKLYNFLKSGGIRTSKDSLYNYFALLEESMFVFTISKFSRSIKERELYQKKVYLPDLGYTTIFKHSKNIGRVFENFIFNELLRKYSEIYFYRNNYECDFILMKENLPIPLQVSYELKEHQPSGSYQREINSLLKTMEKLNADTGYIITNHETQIIEAGDRKISIISAIDFLLFDVI